VGDLLPNVLKETGKGGLAATPTGKRIRDQIFFKQHGKYKNKKNRI
jgi:L-serine dehydratase